MSTLSWKTMWNKHCGVDGDVRLEHMQDQDNATLLHTFVSLILCDNNPPENIGFSQRVSARRKHLDRDAYRMDIN